MTIQDGRRVRTMQESAWIFGFSLVGIFLGVAVLFFAAAGLTALITGNHVPSFGETVDAVATRPLNPASAFESSPGPAWLVYTLWAAISAALIVAAVKTFFAVASRTHDRRTGKTRARDVQSITRDKAIATAEGVLERSLASQEVPNKERLVMQLGTYRTVPLYAQHEDSICIVAPARSGKTMFLGVPWILDAPGAVIVTGTKNDVVLLTALSRRRVGKVFSFDLNDVANWPDKCHWDPVDGCQDPEEALERGRAWAAGNSDGGGGGGNTAWFNARAGQILAYFLHAAATKPGGSLRDVVAWAGNFHNNEPINLLRESEAVRSARWADALTGMIQGKAGETTSSLQTTLQGLLSPLSSPRILDQLCPAPGTDPFRITDFLSGRNTLYLLTGKGATSTAPLVTMFLDSLVRSAQNYSQHQPGQRLWPTLRVVGDEAANVAPIPTLPEVMSDSGGRGIQAVVICQSFAQMDHRWGREEAEAIRANATVTIYLPGIKEQDRLRDLSDATGQYRAARTSYSSTGYTSSTEKENVMTPDDIRRMPVGKGLVFYRGLKHVVVDLKPWWEREDAAQIRTDLAEAEKITHRRMPTESTRADSTHPADLSEEKAA